MIDNRQYMVFSTSELHLVNFNEVMEDSSETVRKSVDGTKTFVKWFPHPENPDYVPSSVEALSTKEGPYSYEEILNILSSEEWTPKLPY
jgi:hypothetical protein